MAETVAIVGAVTAWLAVSKGAATVGVKTAVVAVGTETEALALAPVELGVARGGVLGAVTGPLGGVVGVGFEAAGALRVGVLGRGTGDSAASAVGVAVPGVVGFFLRFLPRALRWSPGVAVRSVEGMPASAVAVGNPAPAFMASASCT